jgi:hypothetical protein
LPPWPKKACSVVYLKNGSIILNGTSSPVFPSRWRLRTRAFAYPMDEVEKITKELTVRSSVANADRERL